MRKSRVTWENTVLQHPTLQDTGGASKPLPASGGDREEQDTLGTRCKMNKSMLEREQGSLEEVKRLFWERMHEPMQA